MKLSIIYDYNHDTMRSSVESYLQNLEANLENTKVEATWLHYEDLAAKQLIEKLDAKFLPIFITDESITTHPQYSLFSNVIKYNNGEYQFQSEGMVYMETPSVDGARYIGANPTTAELVIIEYVSFTCGYCKLMQPILGKVIDTYGSKVSWVIKHFDRGGTDSIIAQSVECAADQGFLRPMIDAIFNSQDTLYAAMQTDDPEQTTRDELAEIGALAGINKSALSTCLQAETHKQKVADHTEEAITFGVFGTPAMFIDTMFVGGAVDEETLMWLVDDILNN